MDIIGDSTAFVVLTLTLSGLVTVVSVVGLFESRLPKENRDISGIRDKLRRDRAARSVGSGADDRGVSGEETPQA